MDFYQELLITALLSVLLAFLLGTLFSVSDRPDTVNAREPAREAKAESAVKELDIGRIGHEKTSGGGDGGSVEEECEGDGEVEMVEIRSGLVGAENVGDRLLEREERFLGLARMGGEGLLGAKDSTDAAAAVKRIGEEEALDDEDDMEREASLRVLVEDVEIETNEAKEMLEKPTGSDLVIEGKSSLEEEERPEQALEKRSQVSELEGSITRGKLVKADEGRFENLGLVEEKNVGPTEKEIVEDVKASQVGLDMGVGEAKEILEVSRESDLLGKGKCLLEEEEMSEQVGSLESNVGSEATEKGSQVSEVQGSTTGGELFKDSEVRLENLGSAKEENVGPIEEEIVERVEANRVVLEIEVINEAKEILEVPRDSYLLGKGKGLLEEEEMSEQATSNLGGKLVNDDEERLENLVIAEEKNVGSAKEGMVLEEGSKIVAEEETGVVDNYKEQSFLNEEDEWEGIEKTEVEKLFSKAVAYIGSERGEDELSKLSGDEQLHLYGLYKVATEGPCYDSQPMALKVSARAKWNAWQKLGHMNPEGAMERYMNLLSEKIPGWKGEKAEGDIDPEKSYSAEEAPSGTSILSTSLNLNSQPDSETKRAPEGPFCSDKDNKSDASE